MLDQGSKKPTSSSSDVGVPAHKPRIGQGRAGVRRKTRPTLLPQPRQIPAPVTEPMPEVATQPQAASEHG